MKASKDDCELLANAPLVTGRYQSWQPGHGVPIRSTVGAPRFWRHGEMPHLREITPYGVFGKGLDHEAARAAYRTRLDQRGDAIVAGLADLARRHPAQALCVLCFEDVQAGKECHRRWFATWFEERHGIVVPELPAAQPSLPL